MNMNTEYQLNLDQNGNQPQRGPIAILKRNSRKLTIVTGILLFAMLIIFLLNAFKPEAQKQAIPETVVRVDVIQAQLSEYPVVVQANGTIEAVTRGNLVAQVRGEIVQTAENFKTGGVFKKGDLLIQIDQRDYLSDVSRTRANLSQAEVAYQQEQANARQAQLDWERLGNTQPAPDLVMRKPQLAAAKAALDSARAAHQTARLNLSRTTVTAPYDGRIIQRAAVRGQYVSVGTPIAEVFATDGVEVRLPLSQVEFNQLGLDQFGVGGAAEPQFQVTVNSEFGTQEYSWAATITRTDSTFDMSTRQIDVIAEVIDPFGKKSGQPALKIGQFVNAQIQGQSIEGVFVIPNKSIREGHYVYVVRDGLLAKQTINIVWQDDQNALVRDGVSPGELVVTTSLNSTLAGAKAKLPEGFAGSTSQLQETAASDSSSVDRPENLASPVEASATNQ